MGGEEKKKKLNRRNDEMFDLCLFTKSIRQWQCFLGDNLLTIAVWSHRVQNKLFIFQRWVQVHCSLAAVRSGENSLRNIHFDQLRKLGTLLLSILHWESLSFAVEHPGGWPKWEIYRKFSRSIAMIAVANEGMRSSLMSTKANNF